MSLCMYVQIGWKIGFTNGLFLSTQAGTRVYVSAMCDTQSCYTVVCPLVLKLN
ncbi:hypothetical protein F383_31146 [Gossypium arboreum]|uniref:Uncharacterized protein n=1 Tax=Gossypium arboreum TaxID=29729 RepID=A0A0B0N2I8_GOSAR|nr:hypothetical protein F383_31146 [Gossypium arboreum]